MKGYIKQIGPLWECFNTYGQSLGRYATYQGARKRLIRMRDAQLPNRAFRITQQEYDIMLEGMTDEEERAFFDQWAHDENLIIGD